MFNGDLRTAVTRCRTPKAGHNPSCEGGFALRGDLAGICVARLYGRGSEWGTGAEVNYRE